MCNLEMEWLTCSQCVLFKNADYELESPKNEKKIMQSYPRAKFFFHSECEKMTRNKVYSLGRKVECLQHSRMKFLIFERISGLLRYLHQISQILFYKDIISCLFIASPFRSMLTVFRQIMTSVISLFFQITTDWLKLISNSSKLDEL